MKIHETWRAKLDRRHLNMRASKLAGNKALIVFPDGTKQTVRLRRCPVLPGRLDPPGHWDFAYTVILAIYKCPRMAMYYAPHAVLLRDGAISIGADYHLYGVGISPASMDRSIPGSWEVVDDDLFVRCPSCVKIMKWGPPFWNPCLICLACGFHQIYYLKDFDKRRAMANAASSAAWEG